MKAEIWYGQINRTLWEIEELLKNKPSSFRLRKELLRIHFLQKYEFDRTCHVPRDDRSFLFLQEGPSRACLLLHGAQGTPAEMRELGSFLYGRGFSVYCPRFSRVDIKERLVSWESWVTEAEGALAAVLEYNKDAHIVGLSLGATIAILLAGMHRPAGMVLLAPALYPRYGMKERLYELGRKVFPSVFFRFAGWNGEVVRAMEKIRAEPRKIEVPMLVLQARDDHRLKTKGLKWLRRCAVHPGSEVVLLPYGSHAITRGRAKEEVFQRICNFLEKL